MHLLIFAGIGPLIGLATFFAANAIIIGNPFNGKLADMILGMAWLTPFVYVVGLIPALVAALAVRQVQINQLRPEWLWATLIGTGVGVIFVVAFAAVIFKLSGLAEWSIADIPKEAFMAYVPICLVPTLVCWQLSRRFDKSLQSGHGRGVRL